MKITLLKHKLFTKLTNSSSEVAAMFNIKTVWYIVVVWCFPWVMVVVQQIQDIVEANNNKNS